MKLGDIKSISHCPARTSQIDFLLNRFPVAFRICSAGSLGSADPLLRRAGASAPSSWPRQTSLHLELNGFPGFTFCHSHSFNATGRVFHEETRIIAFKDTEFLVRGHVHMTSVLRREGEGLA